jgi:hypothetical protein
MFNIGDRVRLKRNNSHLKQGEIGTILEISSIPRVKWDEYHKYNHACSGLCESGYGYCVDDCDLELIENNVNYEIY